MNRKKLTTILATITLLTTLLVPMFLIQIAQADPDGEYMTVDGVLDTDYYTLYPYETDKSLKIGFSKFGELINSEDNVGLEYGAVDPFAPAAGSAVASSVPKRMWLQGWLINITYNHRTLGKRNVWATAMHADSKDYGKNWIRVDFNNDYSTANGWEDPRDSGYLIYDSGTYGTTLEQGGRKTNGTAVTEPIEVLYDGPRKFVAVCRTTLYDHTAFLSNSTVGDIALVEIAITIEFNKVKKEVNLLKDVKSLLVEKEGYYMKIEFSNRGEIDLGTEATGYSSYAHFFTEGTANLDGMIEGQPTVYNANWTLIKTEDPKQTSYPGFSAAGPYPQTTSLATFDVAQAINPTAGYVWFAGFWPSLSDWSIDGWEEWWHSLKATDPHHIDGSTNEPFIPFYIGEWDFILWHTLDTQVRTQFRGVTSYGVVDHHDADDANLWGKNVIDSEVQYYLAEKFNPWDLYDAVHKKDASRWVKFVNGYASGLIDLNPDPLQTKSWDAYCSFAERVVLYPDKTLWKRGINYALTPTGIGLITPVPAGKTLKILWSANDWYEEIEYYENEEETEIYFGPGRYEWIIVGRDAKSVDSAGAALVAASVKQKNFTIGLAGADMWDNDIVMQMPYIMNQFGTGDTKEDYKDWMGRAALNDDWCEKWPVASSNTLGVGGPLANMLSYYGNDFTDAFYGLPEYAGGAYSSEITGVPCWNRAWDGSWNVYNSYDDEDTGYAVISTYKDINGTVIFLVWGHFGRDTYYATQWLHGDAARCINPGIIQLQYAPAGITSIILEIDYTDPKHPTFCIPELLGTISEREWTHTYENTYTEEEVTECKGGIHDP